MLTGSVIVCSAVVVLEVPVAKLSFLAGFGAGYVLGSRAGRERYEQIRQGWDRAKDAREVPLGHGGSHGRGDGHATGPGGARPAESPGPGAGRGWGNL